MKEALKRIVDAFHRYNSEHMAAQAFGLSEEIAYDALVVAPSFTPYRLGMEAGCTVTTLREGAYIAGYLVEKDGLKIAWIKIGSSAGNLIDHLSLCAELSFKRLISSARWARSRRLHCGERCTPSFSISGSARFVYHEEPSGSMLFSKVVPIGGCGGSIRHRRQMGYPIREAAFLTPSIALEYSHLDEIRAFDTDLIEMETSSFYLMTALFELPGVALLVVSDNSAAGVPLVGRTEEQQQRYEYGRSVVLPDMILALAGK
jgi:hypothetical protein